MQYDQMTVAYLIHDGYYHAWKYNDEVHIF